MGNESVLNDDESMESASFDKLIGDFLALKPDAEVQAFQGPGSTHSGVYWITHMSDGYHGMLKDVPEWRAMTENYFKNAKYL
jgi:hypothetical protein